MSRWTTAPLRRVLVRAPDAAGARRWREHGWRAAPDARVLAREHDALCEQLAETGAEVVVAEPLPGNPDAVYVFDPTLLTDEGAILLRPGKALRRGEVEPLANELHRLGICAVARLAGDEWAEGGDTLWLDERTLLVGRGYRTNDAGIERLRASLPGVDVLAFDLPHLHGERACLHLLSLISPLDGDLFLAFLPLLPVRLVQLLRERGASFVEVPEEELDSLGSNVLALGPRRALALAGNVRTRRRMEAAGVEVRTYAGEELSLKGDGGPTCLTLPLSRDG